MALPVKPCSQGGGVIFTILAPQGMMSQYSDEAVESLKY